MDPCIPLFLRLPLEIRRQIYAYLLLEQSVLPECANVYHSTNDRGHKKELHKPDHTRILGFRHSASSQPCLNHTSYKIQSGRLRSGLEDATYECVNKPQIGVNILRVSRQIHNEAAGVLYGWYTFDFDTHVEGCVPFPMNLTPISRASIRHMSIVKSALPYEKDFDRCEWTQMCRFLATQMSLSQLSLGIIAGRPASGWEGSPTFSQSDFNLITRSSEMQWVNNVASIKELNDLCVRACVEHCPLPASDSMCLFVQFSANVESAFAPYLTARMIEQTT